MIYISIPVHEKLNSLIGMIRNLAYYPGSAVILHVSKTATFTKDELSQVLQRDEYRDCRDKVIINPLSVDTGFSNIFNAHVANIRYLCKNADLSSDKLVFHASNDLLVRPGVERLINNSQSIFHTRYVDYYSHWWPGNVVLDDDDFLKVLSRVGGCRIVASQIEGSMYPLVFLKEMIQILDLDRIWERTHLFYPREEIWFSSFAYAMGLRPDTFPYIFSEVQRFDARLWTYFKILESLLPLRFVNISKRVLNKIYFESKTYAISKKDILKIRNNEIESPIFQEGNNQWIPYPEPQNLFGVKRVPRDENNKLRRYILETSKLV